MKLYVLMEYKETWYHKEVPIAVFTSYEPEKILELAEFYYDRTENGITYTYDLVGIDVEKFVLGE